MQKLVKRTAQAQRQANKRAEFLGKKLRNAEMKQFKQQLKASNAEVRQNLRDARKARWEDWEMGPLAPKRDIGIGNYGIASEWTRTTHASQGGLNAVRPKVLAKRCEWAGSPHQLNIAVGDRVVILEGQDKGKLDRIASISTETGTVTLKEYNKGLLKSPLQGYQATAFPITIDSVRLVYPITDPETGVTKDTIINQLKAIPPNMQSENMSLDRWEHGNKWDRLVPGINVVIPWPPVEAPNFTTHAGDTARETVEDRSFYYNLLSPPMPTQVIDELRNKYSRFRTRHEAWYLAKKQLEADAKKRRHETLVTMQMPGDELGAQRQAEKVVKGEPELSDEMLEKLGQIIAQAKAVSLEDAGMSEVSPKAGPSGGGSTTPQ